MSFFFQFFFRFLSLKRSYEDGVWDVYAEFGEGVINNG